MKTIIYALLITVLSACIVTLFILGIDMEVARQDYNNGNKIDGCIFEFVCNHYLERK